MQDPAAQKITLPVWLPPALLALALAPLYLYCLPPVLPPYRDAGEMAGAAWTLGVAHQPGYPLYIISAKLFSLLPLGNPAWRLNLFSALAGLAGVFVFWRAAASQFSVWAALPAALLLGLNFTLRTVSSVPEMYALNFLFAAALLLTASLPGRAAVFLSAFLLGLGMANRMDLLLAAPAVLILLWPALRAGGWPQFFKAVGFALLGFSLYLFLPLRSAGFPLFDWSHPADPATFFAVITRKSYGSTLDLISLNYARGELFLPSLKYYAAHLWQNFSLALALAAAGLWLEWRSAPRRLAALGALFLFSGPLFLYLANMPPNPHALAIVEPYYLLPDLAVAFWVAAGLFHLSGLFPRALPPLALAAAAAAGLVWHNWAYASDRRWLFAAEDHAADALRSVPPGGVLVAKKDVQLFSLWYLQSVKGLRPDLAVVAQGLSGAPWYRALQGRYRPGLKLHNLNGGGADQWRDFAGDNPGGVYATMDAELPREVPSLPRGLVNELSLAAAAGPALPGFLRPGPRRLLRAGAAGGRGAAQRRRRPGPRLAAAAAPGGLAGPRPARRAAVRGLLLFLPGRLARGRRLFPRFGRDLRAAAAAGRAVPCPALPAPRPGKGQRLRLAELRSGRGEDRRPPRRRGGLRAGAAAQPRPGRSALQSGHTLLEPGLGAGAPRADGNAARQPRPPAGAPLSDAARIKVNKSCSSDKKKTAPAVFFVVGRSRRYLGR